MSCNPCIDALSRLVERVGVGDVALLSGSGGAEMAVVGDIWKASRGELDVEDVARAHGFHGPAEGELSSRVWREDPTPLRSVVGQYAQRPDSDDPLERERRRLAESERARREILAALPRHRRAGAALLLRLARERIPMRGVGKRSFLQAIDVARASARRAGELLAADGVLDDPEDVFYLTGEELVSGVPADARDLVGLRRERRAAYQRLAFVAAEWSGMPEVVAADELGGPDGDVVTGTGVSAGVVEGTVRVVTNPDFGDVEPDEVLVAPITDPSWSSIMFVSSALVVDIGGALSHAAVVARELGFPASSTRATAPGPAYRRPGPRRRRGRDRRGPPPCRATLSPPSPSTRSEPTVTLAIQPGSTDLLLPTAQPGDGTHPYTVHTYYFGFTIPEAGIGAYLYFRAQPAFGLCQGGPVIFRGLDNAELLDAAYHDYRATMPWPEVTGNTVRTVRRLRHRVGASPAELARLRYRSPDGAVSFDVSSAGSPRWSPAATSSRARTTTTRPARPANRAAASSSCTSPAGWTLRGEQFEIDCLHVRDRSWNQVRTEDPGGARPHPPLGWTPICFGERPGPSTPPASNPRTPTRPGPASTTGPRDAPLFFNSWVVRKGEPRAPGRGAPHRAPLPPGAERRGRAGARGRRRHRRALPLPRRGAGHGPDALLAQHRLPRLGVSAGPTLTGDGRRITHCTYQEIFYDAYRRGPRHVDRRSFCTRTTPR